MRLLVTLACVCLVGSALAAPRPQEALKNSYESLRATLTAPSGCASFDVAAVDHLYSDIWGGNCRSDGNGACLYGPNTHAWGRLGATNGVSFATPRCDQATCAFTGTMRWARLDTLGAVVSGVVTMGRLDTSAPDDNQHVTKFKVESSQDGIVWTSVNDASNNNVFDSSASVTNTAMVFNPFLTNVCAKYIRIIPTEYYEFMSMRLGFMTCDSAKCPGDGQE
jgi:hypothetical protein